MSSFLWTFPVLGLMLAAVAAANRCAVLAICLAVAAVASWVVLVIGAPKRPMACGRCRVVLSATAPLVFNDALGQPGRLCQECGFVTPDPRARTRVAQN